MPPKDFAKLLTELDEVSLHLVHLLAVVNKGMPRKDVLQVSKLTGWTSSQGNPLLPKDLPAAYKKLYDADFLNIGSYGSYYVVAELVDMVIQDSLRQGTFTSLRDGFERWNSQQRYPEPNPARDLRLAFYEGNILRVNKRLLGKRFGQVVTVLQPFAPDLFDQLAPEMQELYLADELPVAVADPRGNKEKLAAFERWLKRNSPAKNHLLEGRIDLAMARGDLADLERMHDETEGKHPELAGCQALLRGEFDTAAESLRKAFAKTSGTSPLISMGHLPAAYYLLLLLRDGSAAAFQEADSIIRSAGSERVGRYRTLIEMIKLTLKFRQSPTSSEEFADRLQLACHSPLATLFASYLVRWYLAGADILFSSAKLVAAGATFEQHGFHWFAAEALALVGAAEEKSSPESAANSKEIHGRLGTGSLVNLVQAEPVWMHALTAIAQLASGELPQRKTAMVSDRLIWELCTQYDGISLEAFHQQRKGKGWSKGRKIGRHRLHGQYNSSEFAFFTDQDRAICQALEMETGRNMYGYTETSYSFDESRAARALIGHPCVFDEGDRESPLEIVEQQPKLVVVREGKDSIRLSLDPKPPGSDRELRTIKEGPHRMAIIFFIDRHHQLHQILGKGLLAPSSAAPRVVEALQSVASLVTVQSEIGSETTSGRQAAASALPHIHLLPYQAGLRIEFFVRPFGEEGPYFRPGQGGANVFATVQGQPMTAERDLTKELQQQEEVIAACPEIAARLEDEGTATFPTPMEALEALLQLEDLLAEDRIILHWPQGKSLQLAGRATASQFRLQVRKDRNWFAASGNLKVDSSLSLDLMKLLELIEASPGRFVRLDDGRFLALTHQLRERIEELATYGERRKDQNKLRFPPARAAALEDLEQSVQFKADKHWKEWVLRMRQAAELTPEIPSTLQAELRDYQQDGFRWLARLAAWGMGGCLADDMGLGKTLQALALLLHRAAGGPALVVAPTSVTFNWYNEVLRFAPNLNVQLFGEGDRAAALRQTGPRDLVICSYGLLHGEAKRLQQVEWQTVVLDEAQAIKNMATLRSRAAMGLKAEFRLIMTGTPLENQLGELWNLFEFINPGLLGSFKDFQQRFAVPIEREHCRDARRRLKKLIQPFLLRRTKAQVLSELPSRTEVTLTVNLSDEESALYEALRRRALEQLEKDGDERGRQLRILAEIMRLRRACCHPRLVLDDWQLPGSKLTLFCDTLDELLANQHRVLVFSQFVDHLAILRDELNRREISYQYLDGSTPARQRNQRVEAFQAGEGSVFLISLKAGGLGLNLTAADYVIHMDPWWNPAVEDQASDRAHRLGQQRPVTIYRLITRGTIEERIAGLHAAKRDLADSLLEGTDLTGKLSAEELLQLIRE